MDKINIRPYLQSTALCKRQEDDRSTEDRIQFFFVAKRVIETIVKFRCKKKLFRNQERGTVVDVFDGV